MSYSAVHWCSKQQPRTSESHFSVEVVSDIHVRLNTHLCVSSAISMIMQMLFLLMAS